MEARVVTLGARTLDYRLRRSARRTIGFSIDASGLTVSAPRWVTLDAVHQAIGSKSAWIEKALAALREREGKLRQCQIEWRDGVVLPYLGGTATVILTESAPLAQWDEAEGRLRLGLGLGAEAIREHTVAWLKQEATTLFARRLEIYAARAGVRFTAFTLSSAHTRWGSCSSRGTIRLNWRLIHLPLPLIDYVVAHEIAHLHEMNHGPSFWRIVGEICPDYQQARLTLRRLPPDLMPPL